MGSNYHEESIINSSEEVESSDQENNNLGVGRSYECVFCKRGFNTAQALGGHMNIHRKDRARSKPTSNNSSKQEQFYAGPRLYQHIPSSLLYSDINHFASHQDHHPSFISYATASTSDTTRPLYGNINDSDPREPSDPLVPADWRLSLSLEFSPKNLEMNRQAMNQKEELDLELRLGYDS